MWKPKSLSFWIEGTLSLLRARVVRYKVKLRTFNSCKFMVFLFFSGNADLYFSLFMYCLEGNGFHRRDLYVCMVGFLLQ